MWYSTLDKQIFAENGIFNCDNDASVQVTKVFLSEVLEVRRKPLSEPELWSVLCQSVEAIQDLFLQDHSNDQLVSKFTINPNTLAFTASGRVCFVKCNLFDKIENEKFSPPELCEKIELNDDRVEKVLIYSLGQTLQYAAKYVEDTDVDDNELSLLLTSTMDAMCEKDVSLRTNILSILELISQEAHDFTQEKPFTYFVANLHREVLGYNITFPKDITEAIITKEATNHQRLVSDSKFMHHLRDPPIGDTYGKRLGYCPRMSIKSFSRDRWKSSAISSNPNEEGLLSDTLSQNQMRLMQILQLDVNIREQQRRLCDAKQKLTNTTTKKSDVNKSEFTNPNNEAVKSTEMYRSNDAKSVIVLSNPTFKSTVYDINNYPNLNKVRRNSSTLSRVKREIGPEFVIMSCKPSESIEIGNSKQHGNKHMKHLIIILVNGQRLETMCDISTTKVQQLWDEIVHHQKLKRKFLFGLAYIKDGEFIFMEPDMKLEKVAPPVWTERRCKNQIDISSFTIYVRVKFYISINLIRDKPSKHTQYLQLRRDILEERTQCDPHTSLVLGSLALQAEFDGYDESVFGNDYFVLDHYLSPSAIKYFGSEKAKKELIAMHAERHSLSQDLSESEFIKEVQNLTEFGYHFNCVHQGKKAKNSKQIWLGINSSGISLFDITGDKRTMTTTFEWKCIQQMSYDDKHFNLTIIPQMIHDKHHEKIKFFTGKHRGRYLFHLASSHHRLHLMLDCHIKIPDMSFEDSIEHNHDTEATNDLEGSYELKHHIKENNYAESAFVIGTSFGGESFHGIHDETINDSLAARFDNLDCTSSGERRLVFACLYKSPAFGYGLSVTPGIDNGIYIGEIFPGSPAHSCGNLRPGDRIFSVNKILVDCMDYQAAVDLIRKSETKLDLVVSQEITHNDLSPIKEEADVSISTSNVCDLLLKPEICTKSKLCTTKPRRLSSFARKLNHENATNKTPHQSNEIIQMSSEENIKYDNDGCGLCLDSSKCQLGQCEIVKYEKFVSAKFGHQLSASVTNLQSASSNKIKLKAGRSLSENDVVWDSNENLIPVYRYESIEKLRSASTKDNETVFNYIENVCVEPDIDKNHKNVKELGTTIEKGDIYHVVLEKLHGSFGFNIKGGVNSSETEENILVQQVLRGGAADLDGRVKVGDVVLEVNGTNLSGATHQQAVDALRTSSPLAHLTLRRGQHTSTSTVRIRNNIPTTTVRLSNVAEEGSSTSSTMGTSSTSFLRPDFNTPIQHSSSLKNVMFSPVSSTIGWRLAHTHSNVRPQDISPSEGQTYRTTIRVNPNPNATSSSPADDVPVRLRRNSDDSWRTKISFTNDVPNVIRLRVNFGDPPSSGALRRSLSSDIPSNNVRRRSSLEWIPSSSNSSFSTDFKAQRQAPAFDYAAGVPKEQHMEVIGPSASRKSLSVKEKPSVDRYINGNLSESIPSTSDLPDISIQRSSSSSIQPLPNIRDTSNIMSHVIRKTTTEDAMPKTSSVISSKTNIVSSASQGRGEKIDCNENSDPSDDVDEIPIEQEYPFINNENTFEVELEKTSRGIGLSVCGGWDADPDDSIARLIRIKRLYPLQPAAESGKLEIGDVVLAVNNQTLLGLMYFEAIEILRMASNPVLLTVCRPAPGVLPPIPQSSSLLATALMGTTLDESDGNAARYTGPAFTEFDVTLTKIGGSLGFTLVKLEGPNAGHYVKALVKEPALTDGTLQPGDRIILVNGTDISEMSHSESIKFLRELPEEVTLCAWRQVVPPGSPTSPTNPFPDDIESEKKFKPKPLLRKEALDMLNDKSRPKGCRKNLNGGSPLASPRIRRKQMRDAEAISRKDEDGVNENNKRRISSNVSSTGSTTESSSSGIDKGTSSSDRSYSSPIAIPLQTSDVGSASPESPGKPQRPSYLDLTSEHLSPRKQMFGRAPHQKALREDDGDDSEDFNYIRYLDSGDSLLASDDGLTTVTSSEGSPVHANGQSALLKWRGAKLASQEDLSSDKCHLQTRTDPSQEPSSIFTVELEREGNTRLGFTLLNLETNEATGIYIKVVYPGSLAAMDGRLQVGDKLLQINETSVSGMTVEQTIDLLRKQNGKLALLVERETDNFAKQFLLRELAGESGNQSSSVPSSMTRSQSEQEEMLSNEVSILNAKNNNLSSADCLHWKDRSQDENDNYANKRLSNINT